MVQLHYLNCDHALSTCISFGKESMIQINFLQITCKKCQNLELFMTGPGVQFCFKWLKIRFDVPQDCDT